MSKYLPAISESLELTICIKFLNDLLSLVKELNLDHIFEHFRLQDHNCKNIIIVNINDKIS